MRLTALASALGLALTAPALAEHWQRRRSLLRAAWRDRWARWWSGLESKSAQAGGRGLRLDEGDRGDAQDTIPRTSEAGLVVRVHGDGVQPGADAHASGGAMRGQRRAETVWGRGW